MVSRNVVSAKQHDAMIIIPLYHTKRAHQRSFKTEFLKMNHHAVGIWLFHGARHNSRHFAGYIQIHFFALNFSSSNFIPNRKQSTAYMSKDTSVNQYTLMFCWWSPEKPKAYLAGNQKSGRDRLSAGAADQMLCFNSYFPWSMFPGIQLIIWNVHTKDRLKLYS